MASKKEFEPQMTELFFTCKKTSKPISPSSKNIRLSCSHYFIIWFRVKWKLQQISLIHANFMSDLMTSLIYMYIRYTKESYSEAAYR